MTHRNWTRRDFLRRAGLVTVGAAVGPALLGCGADSSSKDPNAPIVIGHQVDLTGALAFTGYWRQKAASATAAYINQNGGIAGRTIELIDADTETNVDVGVRRMRQLLDNDQVDFVLGSEHGGVAMASNRIAHQKRTLYFPFSRTDNVTMKNANRHVFRVMQNGSAAARGTAKWAVENLGKTWGIIMADYAWGHSHRDAWTASIQAVGGTVAQTIGIPVGTQDHIPYLEQLDQSVDAYFIALLGPDVSRALPTMNRLGLNKKPRLTADAIFGTFDLLALGPDVEGVWGMDPCPYELADKDTPHMRKMREIVGFDEHGKELETGRIATVGDIWVAWEYLFLLKQAIEESGWQTKADNNKLIEYLEAHTEYQESLEYPQGDLFLRPEDHQAFADFYILQVEDGAIKARARVPKEDCIYPATVDVRT